jgi:predicted RNA-binding protein YlxR (DUF448 family)
VAAPSELVRIAASADGQVAVGRSAPGRGVWCCSVECFDRAAGTGALARSLRRPVSSTVVEALRARLIDRAGRT